jgi:hypothetical protein
MTAFRKINEALARGPASFADIVEHSGLAVNTCTRCLNDLLMRRDVVRIFRGIYAMPGTAVLPKKQKVRNG